MRAIVPQEKARNRNCDVQTASDQCAAADLHEQSALSRTWKAEPLRPVCVSIGSSDTLDKEMHMNNPGERAWTYEAVQELISLAREGVSDNVIAMKMKRPLTDIHSKLSELGLSAKTGE